MASSMCQFFAYKRPVGSAPDSCVIDLSVLWCRQDLIPIGTSGFWQETPAVPLIMVQRVSLGVCVVGRSCVYVRCCYQTAVLGLSTYMLPLVLIPFNKTSTKDVDVILNNNDVVSLGACLSDVC
jgi:hypothetical protein